MNSKNTLLILLGTVLLFGCVSSSEIVIGKDSNGNEITRSVDIVDYEKAANARVNLAMAQISQMHMTEAKKNLEIAEKYDSGSEGLYLAWGYYYVNVGDAVNAGKILKKGYEKYPKSGYLSMRYGQYLCSQKKYDEGLKLFEETVAKPNFPDVGAAYQQAALCSYNKGDKDLTQKYFELAYNYGGSEPDILFNYASFSYERGNYERADFLMRRYDLFEKNNSAQSLFLKVKIATKLGKYADAEVYGRKLVNKFKDTQEAKDYINAKY